MKTRVIIMGAAGRDFHNFNVFFRNNPDYEVVAFTAADQIMGIANRVYKTIPIFPESDLEHLIKTHRPDQVILAYSDLSNQTVMDKASLVLSLGADFRLMGPDTTMLESKKPVISICAVRTGCGKSQTTKYIAEMLRKQGLKVVIVRHPMPYGDLEEQMCQRYATLEDLNIHKCTIEEREEYEHYLNAGFVLYAGVDYGMILTEAEKEADVILWDGGNNDLPFYRPDYHIVVVDPLRVGNELTHYPGQTNLRMADMVIINKYNSAYFGDIEILIENIKSVNSSAKIITADSEITVDKPELLKGKIKILIVEDGPTLTHGNMSYGAGFVAYDKAIKNDIRLRLVNPKRFAVGTIADVYKKYPHLSMILPAMGYSDQQIKDLEETINSSDVDVVLSATPIDLSKIININKPIVRVSYKLSPHEDIMYYIEKYLY
jgi:predicted GTPase